MRSTAPMPPFGSNSSLEQLCKSREYHLCFGEALTERYLVMQPWYGHTPPDPIGTTSKWFAQGLYDGWPKMQLKCNVSSVWCGAAPPIQPPTPMLPQAQDTRCEGSNRPLVVAGVMSAPNMVGRQRREASRSTWSRSARGLLACFVFSSRTPPNGTAHLSHEDLQAEARREHDMLFFDVPEVTTLTAAQARSAGFKKRKHGHCVFKNYAWFKHAAGTWPGATWVMKVDDDAYVNAPLLLSVLAPLACHRHVFLGPMRWSSWIPEVRSFGILGVPCAVATGGLLASLKSLSKPIATLFNIKDRAVRRTPCDALGAIPPFPFALGGGYVFSMPVASWLATNADIANWITSSLAATPGVDSQVTFFSDTMFGHWLSNAPRWPLLYFDVDPWVHDSCCPEPAKMARFGAGQDDDKGHGNGRRARQRGKAWGAKALPWQCSPLANNRPPSTTTLLVHNLKQGGFRYAHEQTARASAQPYDHARCSADLFAT